MELRVPPTLFGFPAFKKSFLGKYRKKAGETPETPKPEPAPEQPQATPAPKQPAKIVPANYQPEQEQENLDLEERMQDAIDQSNRRAPNQYGGTADDYPEEEQPAPKNRDTAAEWDEGLAYYEEGMRRIAFPDEMRAVDENRQRTAQFNHVIQSPESQGFIQDIKRNPFDPSARLIWADWLEEVGNQPEYAEVIRLQHHWQTDPERFTNDQKNEMGRKILSLYNQHPEWFGIWRGPGTMGDRSALDRGLLQVVTTADDFFDRLDESGNPEQALSNVEEVDLYLYSDEEAGRLAREENSWISQVSKLAIRPRYEYFDMPAIVRNLLPFFGNLSQLSIPGVGGIGLQDQTATLLARSPTMQNIRILNLEANAIGPDGVAAIGNSLFLQNLQELYLAGNDEIGPEGFQALIQAPYLRNLRKLSVSVDNIPEELVHALQQRFPADVLELHHEEGNEPIYDPEPPFAPQPEEEEGEEPPYELEGPPINQQDEPEEIPPFDPGEFEPPDLENI